MMQILVLANNYLLLFAGWEGVGFASYLLIGFHHRRWRAGVAGMKAFIINRAADAGMILGILFLILEGWIATFGRVQASSAALDQRQLHDRGLVAAGRRAREVRSVPAPYLVTRRDGRTYPRVGAHPFGNHGLRGVYLIMRVSFIFVHAPEVSLATAIIGAVSAFLAATSRWSKTTSSAFWPIPPLARSVSCLSRSASVRTRGLFHLFTHAFFKSLLFLGAGSSYMPSAASKTESTWAASGAQLPGHVHGMWVASWRLAAVPALPASSPKTRYSAKLPLPNGSLLFLAGSVCVFSHRLATPGV